MILGVIPAREGSKGLKNKNILKLMGKPLVSWSIEFAINEKIFDKIVLSTDSNYIIDIGKKYPIDIDKRPDHLASDTASTISVLEDIIIKYPNAKTIVVLQPTSPIREKGLLIKCLQKFNSKNFTNLATGFNCKILEYGSHNNLRRQDYNGFFYDDGNIYILKRDIIKKGLWSGEKPCKFEIDKKMTFEIDDEIDFTIVEALMKKYYGT